jgi:hypothetical protein
LIKNVIYLMQLSIKKACTACLGKPGRQGEKRSRESKGGRGRREVGEAGGEENTSGLTQKRQ